MWLRKRRQNATTAGEKWEKNGTQYPFFRVPFFPFFRRSKILPTVPFVKTSALHSPTDKWAFWPLTNTHQQAASADACSWFLSTIPMAADLTTIDHGTLTHGSYMHTQRAGHTCTLNGEAHRGGGGLPGDNFDWDNFGKGNFHHLQES